MTLGLENKRNTVILGILAIVCGYALYSNVFSTPSGPSSSGPRTPAPSANIPLEAPTPAAPAPRARSGEFHPVLRSKRPEDRPDPSKIDPKIHLDVLAKLQAVTAETNGRNLFQFGAPPPPPDQKRAQLPPGPEPIVPKPVVVDLKPSELPPPPIPLKYYGSSTVRASGTMTAFFLDGDEPLIAKVGDVLKKRYRVVRIGQTSVVLEDTQLKREQPLPLSEDANAPG